MTDPTVHTVDAPRKGRRCARCEWRPDPDAFESAFSQALGHGRESGHTLCVCCTRSLTETETQTCERCIGKANKMLREVVEKYALLPEQIGHPATQVYDRTGGVGDELPLPGGNALVLLSGGGTGNSGRRLTSDELARGLEQQLDGREHMVDNHREDGTSVVQELVTWEDEWRSLRGETAASEGARPVLDETCSAAWWLTNRWWLPDAVGPLSLTEAAMIADVRRRMLLVRSLAGPSRTERTVVGAAGYLERRLRWAATELETFDEFFEGLRNLLTELQYATSTSDMPLRAPVPCLDCESTRLERVYRRPDPCDCERPPTGVPDGPEPPFVRIERHRAHLEAWEKAHVCDQGGLVEHWVCTRCDREYDEEGYTLALANWMRQLRDEQEDSWLRPDSVAAMLQVSLKTVRHWIDRELVTVACDVASRSRLLVWWPDTRAVADRIREKREAAERQRLKRRQRESA